MHEFKGPVRFGTEKIIGFPRLIAIFKSALSSDSFANDGAMSGALLRIFGLPQC
jgi:hypothetical protein